MIKELLDFEIDEDNLPVRREQVRARMVMYPGMILPELLLAPAMVWLMWDVVAHGPMLLWLMTAVAAHGIELYQWQVNKPNCETMADVLRWGRRFRWHTTVAASVWGIGWLVMFVPGELGYQALLICVAMGMMAGAITINPVHRPSLFIYTTLLLVPLIVRVALENDRTHWLLAAMLLVYAGYLLHSATKLMHTFELSLRQRFENMSLLHALREREEEAIEAQAAAEQANMAKSKFLATASHDLRQPLQALRLFSEALHNVAKDEQTLRLSGQIGKSVNSLTEMFEDLLDVSRLDSGIIQPRWQHFELGGLFDRLYVDFLPLAQAKGLNFDLPLCVTESGALCDAVVHSDPFLLERILRNLISNAIRYTDQGEVEVRCICMENAIRISVRDTGIGIRREALEHIFEEYYQADNPHRDRRKGLGLGLAIVRRVEELLGYKVAVESETGRGSCFSFAVQAGDATRLSQPFIITQSRYDLSGRVVALVEDDKDIREFTAEIMQDWGCRVYAAESGAGVLRALDADARHPDLLVCDYRLPDNRNALDVMREMREFWGDLPALVVTGDTAPETLRAIQLSGASLLHKPIAPVRLRSAMFFAVLSKSGGHGVDGMMAGRN